MLRVADIMLADLDCADASQSVVEVARLMRDRRLEQVPVCEGPRYVGMVCHTDVVHRCVADGLDPATTSIGSVVANGAPGIEHDAPAEEALLAVLHTGQRCLAVLDRGSLVGLVTHAALVEALPDETVDGILAVVSRG